MASKEGAITGTPDAEITRRTSLSSVGLNGCGDRESQSFLRPSEERQRSRQWQRPHQLSNRFAFHFILLIANLVLFGFAVYVNSRPPNTGTLGSHSAASIFRDAIQFEDRYFNVRSIYTSNGSVNTRKSDVAFSGPPRLELEEAWAKILAYQNFRVQEHELGEYKGQKSIIQLSDGSGFYMTVAVQHALHCVQRLHHYLYKDHYYSGFSDNDTFALRQHTEHCLDWLRHFPGPVSKDWGHHRCVAWEPIVEVLASRAFDPFEPGLLVHPYFGDPYAGPSGAQTGAAISQHGDGLIGGDHGPDI
ncbi:hypothetical protein CHGG_07497 [Chaetomium globosum CBS 148.51]|uniref:DUF3328 domain-containing protein n=1 Tax=Chaetomium globosum (strain ATCC 6205 / CBS 148.51 / DSM 1962 / NBRC 6347 / NRRL 1970) TaxID=306901 RepID=Q2GX07_CHAGB|nr:uncharacterized protein CHGG_07497 [Chaetomium globosum CBS 148.51]EAQ86244.1 hypothetical protein CHGG_07497 [Chaetomium globosum CBS 148.51]